MISHADRHPMLEVRDLSKAFGTTSAVAAVSLRVEKGSTLALLGPSGCGKTTLLRLVAGLEVPDAGQIIVDGEVLSAAGHITPPDRRQIGMVFQDLALFPHMTVEQNVAYGLAPGSGSRVGEALEMVDLGGLGDRMPDTLSGGQKQRVALARALAPEPRILLLDEPFASIDTELRIRVRAEVAAMLRSLDITSVFVTHDQDEAFVVGDEVAVMRNGVIEQKATPAELYEAPASPWVAKFVGEANVFDVVVADSAARTPVGAVKVRSDASGPATVLMRPEELTLAAGGDAVVTNVEFYGHDTSYRLQADGHEVIVRALAAPRHRVGDLVSIAYTGDGALVYEAAGGVGSD